MDDLIRRQAAIDEVNRLAEFFWEKWHEYAPSTIAVTDALKEIPSAQQWIPCSERLPEEEKDVLTCTESGEALVAYVFNDWGNRWVWTTGALGSGSVDVVAWMPLPETYREETES